MAMNIYYQSHSFINRIKIFCMQNIFSKLGDPLVQTKIGKFYIKHRFSHSLPYYLRDFPDYGKNMVNIVKTIGSKYQQLTVIDVGANIGDSVALIKSVIDIPALCLDGDKTFFGLLKENTRQFDNVELEKVMLGDRGRKEKVKFHGSGGTSHLEKQGDSSSIETLDNVLSRHKRFMQSKFLKIDTDGYDGYVLAGAKRYLSEVKPVIFFEYDPYFLKRAGYIPMKLFHLLKQNGYIYTLIYRNTGEYLTNLESINFRVLKELTAKLDNKNGREYYDICIFSEADKDIFLKTRKI